MTQSNSGAARSGGETRVVFGIGGAGDSLPTGELAGHDAIYDRYTVLALDADERARGGRPLVPIRPDPEDAVFRAERVESLAKTAAGRRLLLVHARPTVPIEALLRRVAQEAAELAGRRSSPLRRPPVLALLDPASQVDDLFALMAGQPEPAVIVVDEASRRLTGWSLDDLCAAAERAGHILLLASREGQEAWRLAPVEQRYWHDAPEAQLYDQGYLASLLLKDLVEAQPPLPPAVADHVRSRLTDLAELLEDPLKVRVLGRALRDLRPAAPEEVDALARDVGRLPLPAALSRWFHTQLDRRGQLLAFGLCFFESLWEERVYHYLGWLMRAAWGQPTPGTLDRSDFAPLDGFYAFVEARPPRATVEARYGGQRRMILDAALPELRQHAREALYRLAELMRGSLGPGPDRADLRRAIAAAISDMPRKSRALLDEPLLLLVADGRPGLREPVGEIVGRWYAGDRGRFFETLRRWRAEPCLGFVRGLIEAGRVDGPADPRDSIDAVAVLAVTYAARGERPGELSPELRELLRELSAGAGERTRAALREVAIPQLLPEQLSPLGDWLRDLTALPDLRPAVVAALVAAARAGDPADDTAATLVSRWQWLAAEAPAHQPDAPPGVADTALMAAAEVYAALDRAGATGKAMGTARHLLGARMQPRHPAARRAVEAAMLQLGAHDEALWESLLGRLDDAEIERYVELLRDLHLEERAAVAAGDLRLELDGRQYWLHLDGAPPATSSKAFIEYALRRSAGSRGPELALRAEVALARAFDQAEARAVEQNGGRLIAGPEPADPFPTAADESPAAHPDADFYRDVFLPIYLTGDAPALRPRLQALLAVADSLPKADAPALAHVLERGWPAGQRALTRAIAPRLAEAVELSRLGPLGISPLDYPRAARPLTQALRETGSLATAIALLLLVVAVLVALAAIIVDRLT